MSVLWGGRGARSPRSRTPGLRESDELIYNVLNARRLSLLIERRSYERCSSLYLWRASNRKSRRLLAPLFALLLISYFIVKRGRRRAKGELSPITVQLDFFSCCVCPFFLRLRFLLLLNFSFVLRLLCREHVIDGVGSGGDDDAFFLGGILGGGGVGR